MAKQKGRFKNKPTGLAAYIGRALGKLAAKRDRLAKQLAGVEAEIADVHRSVGGVMPPGRTMSHPAKATDRHMSEATRRKMSDAARARWAAARKAGKKNLS